MTTCFFEFKLPTACETCPLHDGEYEMCDAGAFGYGYERNNQKKFRSERHPECPLKIKEEIMDETIIRLYWDLRSVREFITFANSEFPGMTHMINNARQREIVIAEKLKEIKEVHGEAAIMAVLGGITYATLCKWVREALS